MLGLNPKQNFEWKFFFHPSIVSTYKCPRSILKILPNQRHIRIENNPDVSSINQILRWSIV